MSRLVPTAFALAAALALGALATPALARDPVKGEEFRARVEKRVTRALARLDRALERHELPADVEQQIRADSATAAANVRAAADQAAADGTVTPEEAKTVRGVAKSAVREGRAKYAKYLPEGQKGPKGKKGKKARRARD
ncbi:MAG: hypothetical protein HY908_32090 [Myxococcales bacterium]|nr:hypothetical protein [Myxococcales bacterium]